MIVVKGRNVNHAWLAATRLILNKPDQFDVQITRAGEAAVYPTPVVTQYDRPTERVLFDQKRDANPFFHLFESLWMLAGRDDAQFLDQFVSDFSARFAEDGGRMHGAYGKRWRGWFGGTEDRRSYAQNGQPKGWISGKKPLDQLDEVVRLLKANPGDRQAVIQMWDPVADLGVPGLKDRPCNQQVLLRADQGALDMTVTCRSNDAVWGCYGANAVHFSVLQEYLAARVGLPVGRYWQVSNNWHVYLLTIGRLNEEAAFAGAAREYPMVRHLVDDPESFDSELGRFLSDHEILDVEEANNGFFRDVAGPMWRANDLRREGRKDEAVDVLLSAPRTDWSVAGVEWLRRRGATSADFASGGANLKPRGSVPRVPRNEE